MIGDSSTTDELLVCFDADHTIFLEHCHCYMQRDLGRPELAYAKDDDGVPIYANPDGSPMYDPVADFKTFMASRQGGFKNRERTADAMIDAILNGHKVAITSYTLYPEVLHPAIEELIGKRCEERGLDPNEFVPNIEVIGGFPANDPSTGEPYISYAPAQEGVRLAREYGKGQHIEAAKKLHGITHNRVVLIDDSVSNCKKAKQDGQLGIEVPAANAERGTVNVHNPSFASPRATDDYLGVLEDMIKAPKLAEEVVQSVTQSVGAPSAAPPDLSPEYFMEQLGWKPPEIVEEAAPAPVPEEFTPEFFKRELGFQDSEPKAESKPTFTAEGFKKALGLADSVQEMPREIFLQSFKAANLADFVEPSTEKEVDLDEAHFAELDTDQQKGFLNNLVDAAQLSMSRVTDILGVQNEIDLHGIQNLAGEKLFTMQMGSPISNALNSILEQVGQVLSGPGMAKEKRVTPTDKVPDAFTTGMDSIMDQIKEGMTDLGARAQQGISPADNPLQRRMSPEARENLMRQEERKPKEETKKKKGKKGLKGLLKKGKRK